MPEPTPLPRANTPCALMQYRRLGKTELNISVIGFGASPLGDVFCPSDAEEGIRAVHLTLDERINFLDVSPYYGLTLAEERIGQALMDRRDKAVLATKCGRYGVNEFRFFSETNPSERGGIAEASPYRSRGSAVSA